MTSALSASGDTFVQSLNSLFVVIPVLHPAELSVISREMSGEFSAASHTRSQMHWKPALWVR